MRNVPATLALLVLAAHYLRAGNLLFVLVHVAAPFTLLSGKPWAVRLCRVLLGLGALVWLWTMAGHIQARIALGQPYLRLALILSSVAVLTGGSALLLREKA